MMRRLNRWNPCRDIRTVLDRSSTKLTPVRSGSSRFTVNPTRLSPRVSSFDPNQCNVEELFPAAYPAARDPRTRCLGPASNQVALRSRDEAASKSLSSLPCARQAASCISRRLSTGDRASSAVQFQNFSVQLTIRVRRRCIGDERFVSPPSNTLPTRASDQNQARVDERHVIVGCPSKAAGLIQKPVGRT